MQIRETVKGQAEQQVQLMRRARERRERNQELEQEGIAYLMAASVLSAYDPTSLVPYGQDREPGAAVRYLMHQSRPIRSRSANGLWRLNSSARKRGLERFDDMSQMLKAISQNPKRHRDPVQWAIEAIVGGKSLVLNELDNEQLVGVETAIRWFGPVMPELEDRFPADRLYNAIAKAKLFASLRELIGNDFVGRDAELEELRRYVGVIPSGSLQGSVTDFFTDLWYSLSDHPPLFVHGPGGIGKSSLIAKFVIDHVDANGDAILPIMYLDADRPGIVPEQPATFLVEAVDQLQLQFPEVSSQAERFVEDLLSALGREDGAEISKSSFDPYYYAREFGALLVASNPTGGPSLFVIDTFEEIQYIGEEIVGGLWNFLNILQEAAPQLRVVIAGRATTEYFSGNESELLEFDHDIALSYLRKKFHELDIKDSGDKLADRIVSIVGGNPLCLNLASRLVSKAGPDELREIRTKTRFFKRLKAERIQAQLYLRILGHIHVANSEIKKLANPGLVVRRIDAAVIREVLAGPCEIDLDSSDVDDLLRMMESEIALVYRSPSDNALHHRTDVRRMMLPLILEKYPDVAREIDAAAVSYYQNIEGPIARAEEIYHRLRLGQDEADVGERWEEGVEQYLSNAIEELAPQQRIYLSSKLGISPERDLLEKADLQSWEQITARKVKRLHSTGDLLGALAELRERSNRTPSSPLFTLECETLRQLGMLEEAVVIAQQGLDSAVNAGASQLEVEMSRQMAMAHEAMGMLTDALEDIDGIELNFDGLENEQIIFMLQVAIVRIRLNRKLGNHGELAKLKQQVSEIAVGHLGDVYDHPALFRELVAELGGENMEILKSGIETLGVEVLSDEQADSLAKTLAHWDTRTNSGIRGITIGKNVKVEIDDAVSSDLWKGWIEKNSGSRLDRTLANAVNKFEIDKEDQIALSEHFQSSVDTLLQGKKGK